LGAGDSSCSRGEALYADLTKATSAIAYIKIQMRVRRRVPVPCCSLLRQGSCCWRDPTKRKEGTKKCGEPVLSPPSRRAGRCNPLIGSRRPHDHRVASVISGWRFPDAQRATGLQQPRLRNRAHGPRARIGPDRTCPRQRGLMEWQLKTSPSARVPHLEQQSRARTAWPLSTFEAHTTLIDVTVMSREGCAGAFRTARDRSGLFCGWLTAVLRRDQTHNTVIEILVGRLGSPAQCSR